MDLLIDIVPLYFLGKGAEQAPDLTRDSPEMATQTKLTNAEKQAEGIHDKEKMT